MNAYAFAFAGFMLLGGRAGDLHGRKRMFLVGLGLFTLASLGAGPGAGRWRRPRRWRCWADRRGRRWR
ncbi:hypothetical protein ACGF5O_01100 [Streptomyces sp. NPDC048291]|uniref:hypothetical protein n=1 Tax=Streptomyces sp. NPDC048291 TaxID=3365530 RepID=UPI00371A7A34